MWCVWCYVLGIFEDEESVIILNSSSLRIYIYIYVINYIYYYSKSPAVSCFFVGFFYDLENSSTGIQDVLQPLYLGI